MTTAHLNAERPEKLARRRVWASPEAVDAIVHLRNQLGNNLLLRHVAGAEGVPELRLASRSYPRGPDDICLGIVGGVEFLIDRAHDLELGCPDFHVDVTPIPLEDEGAGVRIQHHLVSRVSRRD